MRNHGAKRKRTNEHTSQNCPASGNAPVSRYKFPLPPPPAALVSNYSTRSPRDTPRGVPSAAPPPPPPTSRTTHSGLPYALPKNLSSLPTGPRGAYQGTPTAPRVMTLQLTHIRATSSPPDAKVIQEGRRVTVAGFPKATEISRYMSPFDMPVQQCKMCGSGTFELTFADAARARTAMDHMNQSAVSLV